MRSIAARVATGATLFIAASCAAPSDQAVPLSADPTSTTVFTTAGVPSSTVESATTTATPPIRNSVPQTAEEVAPTCRFERGLTTLTHAGVERTALFVPADTGAAAPLLVLFHGFAGVYDEFAANTGLLTEAAAAGVSLLVPLGVGEPPTWEVQGRTVDDVGFLNALLDDAATDPCLDSTAMWLAGYSAGAGFAGRLACESEQQLAGIVMNAAVFPAVCDPGPIDVIVAHGTKDLVVPYSGLNIGTPDDPNFLPDTPTLAAGWADSLGCAPDSTDTDRGGAIQTRWASCGGSTVDLVTYVDGGHRWPGRSTVGGEGLVVAMPDLTCIALAAVSDAADPVGDCSV